MKYQKVMVSLPSSLVEQLGKYAEAVNEGNKSGFVADAIREKIDYLRKTYHTMKMRQAYKAAAEDSLQITKEWEELDDELWHRLDELEKGKK